MADISKCSDKRCPSRTICYRFTAPSEPRYQSFGAFGRKAGKMRCDSFWNNEFGDPSDDTVNVANEPQVISLKRYSEMIDEIAAKGKPIADTLIEMLALASLYNVTAKRMIPVRNSRKVTGRNKNARKTR